MTKIAIIQSNYIPWKGYFDIIHDVDVFVFLDDVQMTKRDWRTRNRIKTTQGPQWLTVPVVGGRNQRICEVEIAQSDWQRQHLKTLYQSYRQTPHLRDYMPLLGWLYEEPHSNLSEFNRQTTSMICDILGIETRFIASMDLAAAGAKDDRLIDICLKLGASAYLSGPAARDYIIETKFQEAGIEVSYKDYSGYPEYAQPFPPFDHAVTVLDLLFNCGSKAPDYIWGWRQNA